MTANRSANSFASLISNIGNWVRSAFRVGGRIALGGLAIMAAGIVALAMAVLGVLIALAALIMRLTRGGASPHQRHTPHAQPNQDDGVILEARKTGQGWTVE